MPLPAGTEPGYVTDAPSSKTPMRFRMLTAPGCDASVPLTKARVEDPIMAGTYVLLWRTILAMAAPGSDIDTLSPITRALLAPPAATSSTS